MSHSSVLSIVFESFYQLHNFLFYFLYNFSKFLNKKVPSLPHVHASKEGTFFISSLRTAFFYIFIQKMFCRTNRRCFFFIRTIFQIRNIPVKSIVRQYPLSQWNHILCQYTSDISPKYNIHIVCHPKIGYQDSKMIQISFPFCSASLFPCFNCSINTSREFFPSPVSTLAAQ